MELRVQILLSLEVIKQVENSTFELIMTKIQ